MHSFKCQNQSMWKKGWPRLHLPSKILHKKSFSGAFHNIHKNPFLFQKCNIEQGLERYIDI